MKETTKQAVREALKNTKFEVKSPEESKKLQEIAFECGYRWLFYSKPKLLLTDEPFLYFYENEITKGEEGFRVDFNTHKNTEKTPEEIFSLVEQLESGLPEMGWLKSESGNIVFRTSEELGFGYCKPIENWVISDKWLFCDYPLDWQPATNTEVWEMLESFAKKLYNNSTSNLYGGYYFDILTFENSNFISIAYNGKQLLSESGEWLSKKEFKKIAPKLKKKKEIIKELEQIVKNKDEEIAKLNKELNEKNAMLEKINEILEKSGFNQ